MTASCFTPRLFLPALEQALATPAFGLIADSAWRTFTAQAGPVPPGEAFYLLWATLDFNARPTLAERLLLGDVAPAVRQSLTPLVGSAARVFSVERAAGEKTLVEVLTQTPWRSALAALAPVGSLVFTRLAGGPAAPWPVGPVAVFPCGARDVLTSWLLDRYVRARVSGQAVDEATFYRQVGPALYRWWRIQRDASARLRAA